MLIYRTTLSDIKNFKSIFLRLCPFFHIYLNSFFMDLSFCLFTLSSIAKISIKNLNELRISFLHQLRTKSGFQRWNQLQSSWKWRPLHTWIVPQSCQVTALITQKNHWDLWWQRRWNMWNNWSSKMACWLLQSYEQKFLSNCNWHCLLCANRWQEQEWQGVPWRIVRFHSQIFPQSKQSLMIPL